MSKNIENFKKIHKKMKKLIKYKAKNIKFTFGNRFILIRLDISSDFQRWERVNIPVVGCFSKTLHCKLLL